MTRQNLHPRESGYDRSQYHARLTLFAARVLSAILELGRRVDTFLFGAPVQFIAVSRYDLETSIQRLRAALIPWYAFLRTGLVGRVRADDVNLGWNRWWRHGWHYRRFVGKLSLRPDGVNLRGEIRIPGGTKAYLYVYFLFLIVIMRIVSSLGESWLYTGAALLLFLIMAGALIRFGYQGDVNVIADALDAALA